MNTALKLKIAGSSLLILVVLLCVTQPNKLPSLMLMVPFLLMFCNVWLLIAALIGWFSARPAKSMRSAAFITALPMLLLILQSIGQLTVRDTLILIALFTIAYFYVARMSTAPNR